MKNIHLEYEYFTGILIFTLVYPRTVGLLQPMGRYWHHLITQQKPYRWNGKSDLHYARG